MRGYLIPVEEFRKYGDEAVSCEQEEEIKI